jgi:hypothetical protein
MREARHGDVVGGILLANGGLGCAICVAVRALGAAMSPLWMLGACDRAPEAPGVGHEPVESEISMQEPELACVPAARVLINELSPANLDTLEDSQGDSVDWIELFNGDEHPVDLRGWTLTDDGDEPRKWAFPALPLEAGAFLLVYASEKAERTVVTWDTRVDRGDLWRYLEVAARPSAGWALPGYDASGWATGPSGFGFGDGDDTTLVSAATVYLRTELELSSAELAELTALALHVDYDDAFVAYLNGVEVARAGIGAPGTPPPWDAPASSDHEATLYQQQPPAAFDLSASLGLLTEGPNVLALEVHNSVDSSDLSLVPFLSLGFASVRTGRDSATLSLPSMELHTNFALRAEGERVRLYDPRGCEVDALEPLPLLADESYGRQPDGSPSLGYFLDPTPGAANLTESRPGFARLPVFDPPAGYVGANVEVTVESGEGAEVHLTWDGAEPTQDAAPYTGPVRTGDEGDAVILRARAWQPGLWPSRIATATYLLHPPATLPIVSLVTDPAHLWDEQTGIYAFGSSFEAEWPYHGANFWEDWQRPVHVELWEPDGAQGFALDAEISIHGNQSRGNPQKSLLVEATSRYGASALEHEVFPGLGITSFQRLLLRAGGQDWHGCSPSACRGAHLRDGLMHALAAGTDIDVLAYRPAEVYLNGVYWGIYHLNERPDAEYVEAHHGQTDIDLLEQSGTDPVEGDALHWEQTLAYLRSHDLADPAVYAHVQTLIDVDELQAYLAFEIFYGNTDWPGNNIKYWRPRTPGGRWRWVMYDTDFGLGNFGASPSGDTLALALAADGPSWPNPPWSTELFRLLVQSPEFTTTFLNRYADYLNTALAPEATRARLQAFEAQIALEMPRHAERWGSWSDGVTTHVMEPGAWQAEIDWIDDWLGERPAHARAHLLASFVLAGTWTLELDADPPGAGRFLLTAVEVTPPFTGEYFVGVPVTITAIPSPGYTFAGWSDPGLPDEPTVTLDPGRASSLVARFD